MEFNKSDTSQPIAPMSFTPDTVLNINIGASKQENGVRKSISEQVTLKAIGMVDSTTEPPAFDQAKLVQLAGESPAAAAQYLEEYRQAFEAWGLGEGGDPSARLHSAVVAYLYDKHDFTESDRSDGFVLPRADVVLTWTGVQWVATGAAHWGS